MKKIHTGALIAVIGSVLTLFANIATANKLPFLPDLIAVNTQDEEIYFLDTQTLQLPKQALRKYRLWRTTPATPQGEMVSWLGTKFLPLPQHIVGMVWDPTYQRLLLVDDKSKRITALDPQTKRRSWFSGGRIGQGPTFGALGEVIIDTLGQRLIVVDQARHKTTNQRLLSQVDLANGNRSLYLGDAIEIPAGVNLAITIDPHSYQLFLAYGHGLAGIDLFTHQLRIITDSTSEIGYGATLLRAAAISYDAYQHRLVVSEPLLKRILGVDINSGERYVLDAFDPDRQANLCWPNAVAIHGEIRYIADRGHHSWLRHSGAEQPWAGFPTPLQLQHSDCQGATQQNISKLVLETLHTYPQLSQPAGQAALADATRHSELRFSLKRLVVGFAQNIGNLWWDIFASIFGALLAVELSFLWPFLLVPVLLLAQFFGLILLASAPFITLLGLLFDPSLIQQLYNAELRTMLFVMGAMIFILLGPLNILNMAMASILASVVSLPFIPFLFLDALLQP